ncbi:lipid particle protein [Tothia fuscella]|uniref:Lipid particle protein n=1 Tax=Tothia fuscella TaxID=1048955 RepID=A0A9P4TV51_9PEZI|nr:lipid particle protein [Tothia fuscella]
MEDEVTSTASSSANHLAVLIHGLWGNPKHLQYLNSALREKHAEDKLHILVAARNSGSFTYDGIELGGERVTQEIEQTLEDLARKGQIITKISITGYSLGGLVARYAIGLLYHKGWFHKLEPVNFTTFATPHLGVRTPLLGFHNHLWNVLGARTLSMSGTQLFMIDKFRDTGKPLLAVLADPDSTFMKALAKFKHRSLYANVVNDRSAVYYTTGISRTDPYVDLKSLKVNYIKGWEPVIIDDTNPVSPVDHTPIPNFHQRLSGGAKTFFSRIPILLFLIIFIPIGSTLFLLNAAVQSVFSRQRIRLHSEGKAGIDVEEYRLPLMVEMARDVRRTAEGIFENLNNTQSQEYLPSGSEELAQPESPLLSPKRKNTLSMTSLPEEKPLLEADDASSENGEPSATVTQGRQMEFPTLALTPHQFASIQALDDVGWKKYPVWIHQARHSHAAIIVRMNRKSFDEGRLVVKHWLTEFEI